jgi:asparagine synthase (glutamine-hydrolysing)
LCGIFGVYGSVDKELMSSMADSLKHRGPDDKGFFFDDNVALGNTRLSIIDVIGGHQPIHNEDSNIWIVFNGEIYNFKELRPELQKRGHEFYTNSDTEVIVHAYEEWAENCVNEFNGMWAFALWDSKKKQLFLSRDRMGIKPLYYFSDENHFVFASEIKATLLDRAVPETPNDRVIYEYLVHGLHDDTQETFFSQIKRLLPAHNLLLNESGIRIAKYWDINCINKEIESSQSNDNVYAKEFLELFRDSIKHQLISEVPLGTCLSGGLDSSSIVVIVNQLLTLNKDVAKIVGEHQKTFTACFEDRKIDEKKYVEEIIARTKAEKNFVFPRSRELWKDLRNFVYHQDEPCMGSSVYAQWCVMRLASRKVKVLLDGQGGDELLAGYVPYYSLLLRKLWKDRKIGNFAKELLLSLDLMSPYIMRFVTSSSYSKQLEREKKLLNDDFLHEFNEIHKDNPQYEDLPELLKNEIIKASLPRLLRYEDRNSMAFSVEARVPFLDHRLIEYVFSLPITQRLKNGWTKYILRNAMRSILPENVRERRNKIGFLTPEELWLRELRKQMRTVFASSEFGKRKYFNQQEILGKFDEFCQKGSRHFAEIFWRILNLEIWFRVFIDEPNVK